MAERIRRRWQPRFDGPTRRDRRGGTYDAYLPDPLVGWDPRLPADIAADIADAEAAIRRLNASDTRHVSLEGLARFLLRAESVASSKIEGLDAGARRIIEAELLLDEHGAINDQIAVEVLANIRSMQEAVALGAGADAVTLNALCGVHRTLMSGSRAPDIGGVVREEQNWIGGSAYNPCNAAFIPPPAEHVPALLDDLVAYLHGDDHPAVVQAALAHAQFETVHPFLDGNGRTGRALIHIVLRRRGLAPRFVPPISLVLATWREDYVGGLQAFRHNSGTQSEARDHAALPWLRTFAGACLRACRDAERYADAIDGLVRDWRERLGRLRSDAAALRILEHLPGVPLLTVRSAAALIERSEVSTSKAIGQLVDAGVLEQRNVGKRRYRVFQAPAVIELFTSLERSLASPSGETQTAPPVRPVPKR